MSNLTCAGGAELAVVLRTAQWGLDDVAHDLPMRRVTPERLDELANVLEVLARLLRTRSGQLARAVLDVGDAGGR